MFYVLSPEEVREYDRKQINIRACTLFTLENSIRQYPDCATGGPLEVLLEGHNVRDQDIIFCYREVHDPRWWAVRTLILAFLHEFVFFDERQRLCWIERGSTEEILAAKGKRIS